MTDERALYALLLAAGEGRRFGGQKLLRPHRGRPLVAYALDILAQARDEGLIAGGVAVLPDRNSALRQLARDRGLRAIHNPEPGLGCAHSLRLGFAALETLTLVPDPAAALVLCGDQPRIPDGVIRRMADLWRAGGTPVVQPAYGGGASPGYPLLIDRSTWHLAATLEGDDGLGVALRSRPEMVTSLAVDAVNPDIDTPDDLAQLDAT